MCGRMEGVEKAKNLNLIGLHDHPPTSALHYHLSLLNAPDVGSSAKIRDGEPISSQASARRFFSPPETPRTCV